MVLKHTYCPVLRPARAGSAGMWRVAVWLDEAAVVSGDGELAPVRQAELGRLVLDTRLDGGLSEDQCGSDLGVGQAAAPGQAAVPPRVQARPFGSPGKRA